MLARRDYSAQELTQRLNAKGYANADILIITAELTAKGLINPQRFTENFIHWRSNRGYGPERIALELAARGIDSETIAQHLDIANNDWVARARHVWQKHFRGRLPTNKQDRAKQVRFLQYRGFTFDQIKNVFNDETI